MTCYFRHLKEVFQKAEITVTPQNRQQIDKIIHDIAGVEYKNCPATGRQVKKQMTENEASFMAMLKKAWNNQK